MFYQAINIEVNHDDFRFEFIWFICCNYNEHTLGFFSRYNQYTYCKYLKTNQNTLGTKAMSYGNEK